MSAFESETATKRPIDDHVQNTLLFIQKHESILHNIDNATRTTPMTCSDSHTRPIKLATESFERVLPQDLIFTDNEHVRKSITVLVFLCDEISQLREIAESRFFRPLLMFGQNPPDAVDFEKSKNAPKPGLPLFEQPGMKEKMVGKFLPFLQELSNFIDRCYSVCLNLVQQLASLMDNKELLYRCMFSNMHLTSVFKSLGELLTILISLDSIVHHNENLQDAWGAYKSMISLARNDAAAFATSPEEISKFERLLVAVDQSIMIGEIFKGCIEQNFESAFEDDNTSAIPINVRNNVNFMTGELLVCMKQNIESSVPVMGTQSELNERMIIMGCVGTYALYRQLLPANQYPDTKLHKIIWGIQKIVPFVVICETVMWNVGEFILSHAPLEVKKLDPVSPEAYRRQYIQLFDQSLTARTTGLVAQAKSWMILFESRIQNSSRFEPHPVASFELFGSILLKGLSLAKRVSYLAQSCLVMHSTMQVPLSRANLQDVATLVETLKAIEYCFARKDQAVAELHVLIVRGYCETIYGISYGVRQKLQSTRKLDAYQVLLLTIVILLEHLLMSSDSFSPSRQIMLAILLEIVAAAPAALVPEKEAQKLYLFLRRLNGLSNLAKECTQACDTAFLYYHTDLLQPLVQSIYAVPTEANRLQYVLSAFEDGIRLCQTVLHADATPFFVNYRDTLREAVMLEIVQPLCRDIETDLRLHIHTKHLDHMHALNPKTENLKPLRPFLDLAPLRILGLLLDVKAEVTHYLDMNFYNLTTIALHDWRTYSDMRSLAAEKLGLMLMDNYLPMGSLEMGLDVLQIMRNIHVFVSRFTYNMNMQQFVEYRPDKSSKHLNTIKIQSIAASIRQHGLGVLNTTVNFTYQFLSSKFHIFSQFLFDDYIRAHLSREHRWFKKHKNEPEINNMYPYDRALKFVRDIRKLGVNEAGKSFLDQFRILITEIGNALGYVRMVRSASMYYCSEAVKYLPDFEDIISFEDCAGLGMRAPVSVDESAESSQAPRVPNTGANYCDTTLKAAENLDETISTLVKNFGEGSDYFKVLVNVFQSVLLTAEHDHLKNFYMIVPALCVSWIDASLLAKDSMYKTTRGVTKEMYFTDDGFPVGIAYCLAILKQTRKNEALHWIESVNKKIKVDTRELAVAQEKRAVKDAAAALRAKEKAAKKKGSFFGFGGSSSKSNKEEEVDAEADYDDQEEVHTLQMTSKKLEAYRRETEQLFYSMSGAEIFFKRTDVDT